MTQNEISKVTLDAAFSVHKELGPGLLESVYEIVMAYELRQRGFSVERQVPIAIRYKARRFADPQREAKAYTRPHRAVEQAIRRDAGNVPRQRNLGLTLQRTGCVARSFG